MDFIEQVSEEVSRSVPTIEVAQDTLSLDEQKLLEELPEDVDARINALEVRWFFALNKLEKENKRRELAEEALQRANRRIEILQLEMDDMLTSERAERKLREASIFTAGPSVRTQLSERSKVPFSLETIVRVEAVLALALVSGRSASGEQLRELVPEISRMQVGRFRQLLSKICSRGRISEFEPDNFRLSEIANPQHP